MALRHYTSPGWTLPTMPFWDESPVTYGIGERVWHEKIGAWQAIRDVLVYTEDTWHGYDYWVDVAYSMFGMMTYVRGAPEIGLLEPYAHGYESGPGHVYTTGTVVHDNRGESALPYRSIVSNNRSHAQWNDADNLPAAGGTDTHGLPYGEARWVLDDSLGPEWADVPGMGRMVLRWGLSNAIYGQGLASSRFATDVGPDHASQVSLVSHGPDAGPTVRQSQSEDTCYWGTLTYQLVENENYEIVPVCTYYVWAVESGSKRLLASIETDSADATLRLEATGATICLSTAPTSSGPFTQRISSTDHAIPSGFMGVRAIGTAPVSGPCLPYPQWVGGPGPTGTILAYWVGDELPRSVPSSLPVDGASDTTGVIVGSEATLDDGEFIEWTVDAPTGGEFRLDVTTSNENATRLAVDGVDQGVTVYGMTIPESHPRIWFTDDAKVDTAVTWFGSNSYTPTGTNEYAQQDRAMWVLLNPGHANAATEAATAIAWARARAAEIISGGVAGTDRDEWRWYGESMICVYDWLYDYWDAGERAQYVTDMNSIAAYFVNETWGGNPMFQSNYWWGQTRNQIMWALASYHENQTAADTLLANAIDVRFGAANGWNAQAAASYGIGGAQHEGSEYGPYLLGYGIMPFETMAALGYDLRAESIDYWLAAVYDRIYMTSLAATTTTADATATYRIFPHSDSPYPEYWRASNATYGFNAPAYMVTMAQRYPSANIGQHARQWLSMVTDNSRRWVKALDPGGTTRSFSDLPLDYYAPGFRLLYIRDGWGTSDPHLHIQAGVRGYVPPYSHVGHGHEDWGSWQFWRGGRYLSRESYGYYTNAGDMIVGPGGTGSVYILTAPAHNVLLVNDAFIGAAGSQPVSGQLANFTSVTRLESTAGYTFMAVTFTGTRTSSAWVSWVREFVWVRGLDTLVILDRVESASSSAVKTNLIHSETLPTLTANGFTATNGTQAVNVWTLLPASGVTPSIVTEGGSKGQYRVEIDTAPGTAQSYVLTIVQGRDSGAAALSPSVVDNGGSYTLTLQASPAYAITFVKGMASSGGTITINGAAPVNLRTSVQSISVSTSGVTWGA